MDFHSKLIHELIVMDRRDSTRRGYNPYALPQYLAAAVPVTDAASFATAFVPTRGMHGIAKRLGLPLDVERGRWITKG
jgi:hypothetical protein